MLHPRFKLAPLALAATLAVSLLAGIVLPAHAQAPSAAVPISLPAQSLGTALNELARQAKLQLMVHPDLVAGKMAPAVSGTLTVRQALERLLVGSGLEATAQGNAIVVKPIPVASSTTATLSQVTVTANRESADGPVGGFVPKRSSTATKTDALLSETPQSVSVIPREQIQAQAADSLDQALQYTAGVSMFEGGGTRSVGTRFVVRGFSTLGTAALYLNGSKLPTNSLTGAMEPFHYERIELLKGPASIMYGQTTPGGVINLVGKRPTAEPVREVELQAGSWNRKQVAVDLGGPATQDGRVRYRLTALQRDSDSMVKENPNDRTSLAGALEWQLTDSTMLTLLGSYDKIGSVFDPGKPLDGTLLPNPGGRISRNLFVGEPGQDRYKGRGHTLGYRLEHSFNDAWQFRQNVLAYERDVDWNYSAISARVNAAAPRLGTRVAVRLPAPVPQVRQHGPALRLRLRPACAGRAAVAAGLRAVDQARAGRAGDSGFPAAAQAGRRARCGWTVRGRAVMTLWTARARPVDRLVPSGNGLLVPSGTGFSCYRANESPGRPMRARVPVLSNFPNSVSLTVVRATPFRWTRLPQAKNCRCGGPATRRFTASASDAAANSRLAERRAEGARP